MVPATVAILTTLKMTGVPVHAISNYNREKFNNARPLFPFLDTFDALILSGNVRMVKPDPEICEPHSPAHLGCPPKGLH